MKRGDSNINEISEMFTKSELTELYNKKVLSIYSTPSGGNDFKLKMEVKNIETLQTKLFELIPENYYRKFATEI